MQRILSNLLQPKTRLMRILWIVLVGLVAFMGLAQLRLIILLISFPDFYKGRDIFEVYLMGKSLIAGINPYLPLDQLSSIFTGSSLYYPHPSPYPPFVAILAVPLTWFGVDQFFFAWFGFEISCLFAIAVMVTILWTGKINWLRALIIFCILLALYPVFADLIQGQFGILISALLLAALLAMRRNKRLLAGILIGVTIAIKIFTWPFLIYLILKKEWRTAAYTIGTVLAMNLIALGFLGVNPFYDYLFHVAGQTFNIFKAVLSNLSVWSIGYRLFVGTDAAIFSNYLTVPPLIYLPKLAPVVSAGLAAAFFIVGMIWAIRTKQLESSFAILICMSVAVSPVSWDHYYVLIIISAIILYKNLQDKSFPPWMTALFLLIILAFFLLNDKVGTFVYLLNGGEKIVHANGNQVSFMSSLLTWLPLVELIMITILIWKSHLVERYNSEPLINA